MAFEVCHMYSYLDSFMVHRNAFLLFYLYLLQMPRPTLGDNESTFYAETRQGTALFNFCANVNEH